MRVPRKWLFAPLLIALPLLLSDSIADPGRLVNASSQRVRVLDASKLRRQAKSGPAQSRLAVKSGNRTLTPAAQQKMSHPGKLTEVRKVEAPAKTEKGGSRQ